VDRAAYLRPNNARTELAKAIANSRLVLMPLVHKDVLERLCRARDALREVNECPPSIQEVARNAGISTFHFIRLFKACFGETPHQVRVQAQIERAKRLLYTSDQSVTEVCLEVGFSSLGSFSYAFSQRVGLPPSRYKEKIRRIVQEKGEMQLTPGCLTLMAGPL
jgi:AraC-like DNA-binding protein